MTPTAGPHVAGRPRYSIVSAVYNVERYLDEFIASIEAQDFDLSRVQVILVDDGSTDTSPLILAGWQRRRPELVTVLTKENGGQASARNLGIEHASGEWVAFADPDDLLQRDYLAEVDAFIEANPPAMMVATRREVLHEKTGKRTKHPLDEHFTKRNRLRNLNDDPAHFHGHAPCAFFRRAEVQRQQLRFDVTIRPTFEDVHFCSRYLLNAHQPLIGYVQSTTYVYRKRADQSSTLDVSWTDPGRWDAVPTNGYLPLLREAAQLCGSVPAWMQTMMLYELSWYFWTQDVVPSVETAAHGDVAARFYAHLAEVVRFLDPESIRSYEPKRLSPAHREVLLHSFDRLDWHSAHVVVDKVDVKQGLMRASHRYKGTPPEPRFYVDGVLVPPVHDKIRDLIYFDRTALNERIVWLPLGALRVALGGVDLEIVTEEPATRSQVLSSAALRRAFGPKAAGTAPARTVARRRNRRGRVKKLVLNRVIRQLAGTGPVRRIFGNAWVLIDRVQNADDSAEHLFHYLRRHQPKVNAWFVVAPGTPDYRRLRAQRERRLVPYGSLRWKLLMLNCRHLISSHADVPVTRPRPIIGLAGERTWRTTFLQHGVMKDDLSGWFNPKDFDIFVTSTPAEYRSVAGDNTAYRYTDREVKLTGLPRFDKLLEAGSRFPAATRDLVVFAPTWRRWLATDTDARTGRQAINPEEFRRSEFVLSWLAVIGSPRLRAVAEEQGLTLAVLLHPDLQPVAAELDLPEHVIRLSFESQDIRETFARARLLVTDYSSMAFNAAYIDRPLVYFQFDRDRVLGGGHLGRRGYFDYGRDGFGPVAFTAADAVDAITDALGFGPDPRPEYRKRIADAFPVRDGHCCERVFEVVRDSTRAHDRSRP